MASARPKRRLPLWLRIAIGVVLAIFAVVAAGVVLRYWITSDSGRAFIVSQIDGRRVGPLGTIRLSGLKGDPLQAATVADIALVDDDGVWVRAKDAEIQWTPGKLFGGELEIQAVKIRMVDMLRLPHTTYESENRPPPDIGLKLDELVIDEFRVADNVIGATPASYRIAGGAARTRDGAGFARLGVAPLSGPPDKVDASAEWTAAGVLKGQATIAGPPGGIIAALTQAPAEAPVAFIGSIDGSITRFTGTARLTFGSDTAALIDLSRNGDTAHLSASIAADRWPLMAPLAARTGGGVSLEGDAQLADLSRTPIALTINAPAGRIDASGVANLDELHPPRDITLTATGLDLARVAPPLTGKVNASGSLRLLGLTDFNWRGNATAASLTYPSGAVASASGQIAIRKDRSTIMWEAPSLTLDGARVTSLESLAPARYTLATRGEVNLATHTVEVSSAQLRGAPGDVSARGAYNMRSGAIDFAGAASFVRLSDVTPLTGSARGQWTVRRSSFAAPVRITADAAGRNVSSHIATLATLAGPTPSTRLTGVVHAGRFTIESGAFSGDGLAATMTGRITDDGAITGHATGTLTRPLTLPATTLTTATATADITGALTTPHASIRLSDAAADIAGLPVRNITGESDLRLGDKVAGAFTLAGGSGGQQLLAAGRIEGGDGDWRVTGLNGRLGGVQVTASQLGFSGGVFSAAFDANGSIAGIGGFDRGTLTARGTVKAGDDLTANITGQFANLRQGKLRFDMIAFEAKAANNHATLTSHVTGSIGAPIDLTLSAEGAHSNEIWSGTATLKGSVDQLPVATSRDARWTYGNGWSVDTALAALGGQITAALSSQPGTATANLEATDLDLRAISRLARITPITGKASGKATFSNGPAPATGDLQLAITDANPFGVTADPVSVNITSHLRDAMITTVASGSGQGFRLEGGSMTPMAVGEGFNVVPNRNAPVEGQLDLDGKAEQLWALFGPEGQVLRGQLKANVRLAGTLNSPTLTGGFGMTQGAYEHGETGLRLRDITAKGELDHLSARITEVSANDGQGGTVTGSGKIDWSKDINGNVQFTVANLRALGRDDRNAVLSGEGAVTLDKDAIRVTGEFDVAQARISIEQSASAAVPKIPIVRRVNFPNQEDELSDSTADLPFWRRPLQLDLQMKAPRRVVVFGRGLDTEWSADIHISGPIANPNINGTATMVRGDLDLAGKRFQFDTGSITLDGPIRQARLDISAERNAQDIDAKVHVTGSPIEPKFTLESTPPLPQDEILARVLFGRSASELSAFEAAQLAAGLAQLAGGQAGFDPIGLVRQATGLDRVAIGASGGVATVSAGKYVAEDVYVQVGTGEKGGVGAAVEWEPRDHLSITSSAQDNGDTKIAVRWKKDY